jgi:hypothetical protein
MLSDPSDDSCLNHGRIPIDDGVIVEGHYEPHVSRPGGGRPATHGLSGLLASARAAPVCMKIRVAGAHRLSGRSTYQGS